MTTAAADAVRATAGRPVRSRQARRMFTDLMALDPHVRRGFVNELPARDLQALFTAAEVEGGTPYAVYVDDPVGFTEDVLGEATWSKQRAVLQAIPAHKRVAVPSAFGTGKTHTAARAALWRSLVHPVGTSLTVTTATRLRQVQRQLWPHIRAVVNRAGLPVHADMTQLKAVDSDGTEVVVAYGFSAPPHDEAAVQGIHAPRLFIVVDEAGGISRVVGKAMRGLYTGDDARLLAIGNPPTDDEGSWFEGLCGDENTHVVRISAYDAPLLSGEVTEWCRTCPPESGRHRLASHITDPEWVAETIAEYGEDAPFVVAKVHARFPKGGAARTIPADWVELALEAPEPAEPGYQRLCDLTDDEDATYRVKVGAWVRLGVDVAADGGDELAISRAVGDLVTVQHTSAGPTNASAVDVAGKVLTEIRKAQRLRGALHTSAPVRVKIDGIGVGWGVASVLKAWRAEGVHDAEVVPVIVSEKPGRQDEGAVMRPARKRDEMWLATRSLLQPRHGGTGTLRLRVDKRTVAQLSAPTYGTSSTGLTVIESKPSMKARGLTSPDRAEAVLLAVYEPLPARAAGGFRVIV